jgi:hypothetical protein
MVFSSGIRHQRQVCLKKEKRPNHKLKWFFLNGIRPPKIDLFEKKKKKKKK